MRNWKIWTAFLAVFLAGGLCGMVATGMIIKMHFAPPKDRESFRAEMTDRLSSTLNRELDLDEATAKEVRVEVATTLDHLEDVHAEFRPKAKAIVADGINRVKSHLDDEQRAKLDEMIRKNREEPAGIFHLPPPPPPPPFP